MMLKLCFVYVLFYTTVVKGEPEIVISPFYNDKKLLIVSSFTAKEGDNFLLKCELMEDGKRLDEELIWVKHTFKTDIILAETYLHFNSVSPEDEGIYFCRNSERNLRKVFFLEVISSMPPSCVDKVNNDFEDDRPSSRNSNSNSNGEPHIVMTKQHNGDTDLVVSPIKVTEGQSITLKCELMAKRKKLHGEITWGKETSTSDLIITPNADLHFTSISKDDEGTYFCENTKYNLRKVIPLEVKCRLSMPPCHFIDNIVNNDDESNFYITREPQLAITQQYYGISSVLVVSHVKVTERHDITLKCVLMVNGKPLDDETTWGKETFTSDIKLASTDLHLTSVSTDDAGIYFCENSKYNLRKIISLKVKSGLVKKSCNFNRDKANKGKWNMLNMFT